MHQRWKSHSPFVDVDCMPFNERLEKVDRSSSKGWRANLWMILLNVVTLLWNTDFIILANCIRSKLDERLMYVTVHFLHLRQQL